MKQLLDRAGQAEGETHVAQFVFAVDAELELSLADALDVGDCPCPIVVGVVRDGVEVVALIDVFPFDHEVAHQGVQDAFARGEIKTQVEGLVVDARLEVLGFGGDVVVDFGVDVVVLCVDAGVFTVGTENGEEVVAGVGGHTVGHVGGVLHHVDEVRTVGDLDFQREGELHVVFDTDVALVGGAVLGGDHGVQLVEAALPAEFNGVVAVIAHPETALGEILVYIGTEVGGLRPVGLPATDLQVDLVGFAEGPLVVDPVEVGENLVLCRLGGLGLAVSVGGHVGHVLVAEFRSEHTDHDGSVQVFALVLAADVGADPAAAEVVVFVGDGLGDLSLYVTLEGHVVGNVGCEGGNAHSECGRCDFPEVHIISLEDYFHS